MSNKFEFNAQLREKTGKGQARRLRRLDDQVPAVIYGAGKENVLISLSHNEFFTLLGNEATYSHILTIKLDNKKEPVVLKALQRHSSKPRILHADFLRVEAKEKLTMSVPLHFENEEIAVGVKAGGVLSRLMTELEIKCLPGDLPEFIAVDVSGLNIDDSLHILDVQLPKGVELATAVDDDHNLSIVNVHKTKAVKEDALDTETSGEATEETSEKSE